MYNYVHFPIGKTINSTTISLEADSIINEYTIIEDVHGSRWIKLPLHKVSESSTVKLSFTIVEKELELFEQTLPVPAYLLKPSEYIDSDDQSIIDRVNQITTGISSLKNKARYIQFFVRDYIDFKIFMDCGLVKASETLEMKYGTCINSARLFVALCRASGIPARSIWGALNPDSGTYIGHHNWAEYLGADNKWHPVDFKFSSVHDLNDIRYLDLLYAPEENEHLEEYKMFTIDSNGDYFFYDGSGSAVDGLIGIQTDLDSFPRKMGLSMNYSIALLFD